MIVNHNLSMDLVQPGQTPRLYVKQGDNLAHRIRMELTCNGESWAIPEDVNPLIRYRVQDPDTGEEYTGAFDELPSGQNIYEWTDGVLILTLSSEILCAPGLMTADVLLRQGDSMLSTLNFEICILRPPVEYTDSIITNYYAIATLDQINEKFAELDGEIAQLRSQINGLNP